MENSLLGVGARVESLRAGVRIEGTVQSIVLQQVSTGYAAMVKVKVDKQGDIEEEEIETPAHFWKPVGSSSCTSATCARHSKLASDKLIDLFQRVKVTKDPVERRGLLIDMASSFFEAFDETDPMLEDWAHDMCHAVRVASRQLDDAWMELGRTLFRWLNEAEHNDQVRASVMLMVRPETPSTPPEGGGLN